MKRHPTFHCIVGENLALSRSLYVRSHAALEVCTSNLRTFAPSGNATHHLGMDIFVMVQLPSAHRQRSLLHVHLCVRYKSAMFLTRMTAKYRN